MKTVYFKDPTKENIEAAAKIIRDGGLLAIPTETVYGLGADALNEDAVLRIFLAKGRPQDNPLIIHVPDSSWLARYCEDVPPEAYALAEKFWPGPLTMILPRKPIVPLRTTGGLETVGVRCPNHPITRAVIAAADVPIAAPSGNTSGRPSPTCIADMIEDMDGKIEGMFDGGPCAVGVESTIIDLTCTPPRLLRPGGLPLEALEAVLGHVDVDKAVVSLLKAGERPKAPGMKYRHYAPKAPVTVVTGDPAASAQYIQAHLPEGAGVICFTEYKVLFPGRSIHDLGPAADKEEQARRVFDALREFDHEAVTEIYAQCPDTAGLGLAVANRLKKAAGFQTVTAADGAQALAQIDALAPGETIEVHGGTVDAKGEIVASIIHREGAERLATYGGDEFYAGHSALTVNAYGKGKAYFVGTPLDETGMSAFMAPIIKELDLKSLDTPEDVSLSVRYGDGGTRYAFLINNSAADKRLCLSELNGGTELLTGTVINDLIELKPYGVDVIALR